MFSWLTQRPRIPQLSTANPGRGHRIEVSFSNAQRKWTETLDLATSLADALRAAGNKVETKQNWLKTADGFTLLPQVVSIEPLEKSGVSTTSTIQVAHDTLIPNGIFEYQHSSGDDVGTSFSQGFKSWVELDLTPLRDCLRPQPEGMTLVMNPAREGNSVLTRDRRIVFGPPLHMAQRPSPNPQEHDFCPCCLFTNSLPAFEKFTRDSAFFGIRLYAMRTLEGEIVTDCRVNGEDWPAGAEALARYVGSWPDRGFEYRKQYVCLQTFAGS